MEQVLLENVHVLHSNKIHYEVSLGRWIQRGSIRFCKMLRTFF